MGCMSKQNQDSPAPRHIGFIIDGNRRWARAHGLPQLEGHRRGERRLKAIAEAAFSRGVEFVTVYVFSTENWKRSSEEVNYLMDMAYRFARSEADDIHRKGIRVRCLGSADGVDPKLLEVIAAAEAKTINNTKGTLAFCFNYGGQQEIVSAVRTIVASGIPADDVTPEVIASHLYAPDIPPLDLIIRTSGEQRLSNFMLWRASYSELYFVEKHWPDFTEADLDTAFAEFGERTRRFGS